jgi:PAS domain S-box-containing protein
MLPNIEKNNNVLLAACFEQLIISSSIDAALENICNNIIQFGKVQVCAVVKTKTITTVEEIKGFSTQNYQSFNQSSFVQQVLELYSIDNNSTVFYTHETANSQWFQLLQELSTESIILQTIYSNAQVWGVLIIVGNKVNLTSLETQLPQLVHAIGAAIANKETQEQLYAYNEVYETTLATLNQLIWELDLRNNTMRIMGFAPRIGTYTQQTIQVNYKKQLLETVHIDDRERVIKSFDAFLLQPHKSIHEQVYRIISADANQYIWVETKQTLLCDADGKPAIIVGTTADINDTKQVAFELEKHKEQNEFLVQMLQESNEKLNTILNSSKEIILTIDLQTGQIENVNDAIKILGYSPKEWIGQYYTKWTLEKRRKFHDLLKHASESDTSVRSQQILFSTKKGDEEIPFEFSTSVFSFKNKKYLLCVLRDIRERLEYEKNISQVTNQLTHLINNIDDVYAIYNLKEKKYEFVSDNIEGFFGCSKETFMQQGLFWQNIIHIEDATGIVKQMDEVIKNKSRGEFFYRITTPIGETKMLLEKITVAVDEDGEADRVYIVKSDYTHIENAEQSLIESERKFRFISENITDFISIIDNDGRFLYASPSAEKVIGYTPEELIGEGSIYIIHPNDVPSFIEDVLEKAVFEKKESQLRYRLLSKKGEYYWVETYFKPIIDAKNETTSIICSTRDVTEREQLMKDLELALEKERELNELRSQFVSTASHQFRTPLTVIQSGVELMEIYLENLPEEKQTRFKKQFHKIQDEVVRLQDLMNDILLLGRADAKRTPYKPERKNLVQFCQLLVESKYNNRFAENRQVIIEVKGNEQAVDFDPKLLDHALENILSNAYKYSEDGNITMTIQFEYDNVNIAISDKGIGIPENDLVNLFQPFYRAGNTTEIEGTGLGLSIVKEFIEKHGGQIFVVSELNKGTTVNVILPIKSHQP